MYAIPLINVYDIIYNVMKDYYGSCSAEINKCVEAIFPDMEAREYAFKYLSSSLK